MHSLKICSKLTKTLMIKMIVDETAPRDLIDNYLIEMKKGREGFNKDELVIIIFDLFAAGSETTSTTLRYVTLNTSTNIAYLLVIIY